MENYNFYTTCSLLAHEGTSKRKTHRNKQNKKVLKHGPQKVFIYQESECQPPASQDSTGGDN